MTDAQMLKLYVSGKNYAEIAKIAGIHRKTVSKRLRALGSVSRSPSERRRGDKNPAWKGGRSVEERGYVIVRTPEGRDYEHRVVMEKQLGRKLESWEHVHHKNEKKGDNRIENLKLTTHSKHMSDHHQMTGWALKFDKCVRCKGTAYRHRGHGLCASCFGANDIRTRRRPLERWARGYDACVQCGTTERRHGGHGLCSSCKSKAWKKEHATR